MLHQSNDTWQPEAIESIRTVAVLSLNTIHGILPTSLAPPRKEVVRASMSTNIFRHCILNRHFYQRAYLLVGSQLIMKGEYTQRDFLIILIAMLAQVPSSGVACLLWRQNFYVHDLP